MKRRTIKRVFSAGIKQARADLQDLQGEKSRRGAPAMLPRRDGEQHLKHWASGKSEGVSGLKRTTFGRLFNFKWLLRGDPSPEWPAPHAHIDDYREGEDFLLILLNEASFMDDAQKESRITEITQML